MPDQSKNPLNFWKELKRRKVVRVIIIYAAAALAILEAVDIIFPRMGFPDWTITFVIFLLVIGFVITVILSWIYDIHPEEGIIKTEPAHKIKEKDIPKSSNSWKFASYISFVVIFGLIVLNIIPRSGKKEILDTSIAVLPLVNLSSNDDVSSIGFTNEIIMELQKIKAFSRVLSLTSTMQFAEHQPTIPEIGQILNVNYIIEGTIQKQHDKISIIIQVISAKEDDHIWAEEFKDAWENRFNLQDQIALVVAEELQAVITPEEKQRIEKVPTTSLTAYDYYQRGRALQEEKWWSRESTDRDLQRVEDLYVKALEHDSTFALAYTGLAWVYYRKNYYPTFLAENFLDSMLILADKALSFDPQLSEAFVFRGIYYQEHGAAVQAIDEYKRALHYNPNEWLAYSRISSLYRSKDEYLEAIKNYYIAASLHRGTSLPEIYRSIAGSFLSTGFNNISRNIAKEALVLDNDSASYYRILCEAESYIGRFEDAVRYRIRAFAIDSTFIDDLLIIGNNYLFLGKFEKALEYYKKLNIKQVEMLQAYDNYDRELRKERVSIRLAQAYSLLGMEDEAKYHLHESIVYLQKRKEMERAPAHTISHEIFALALFYACLGDKDKAFEYLRHYNQMQHFPAWLIIQLKVDPGFTNIRDKPEFQQIYQDVEAKYQAEHERVKQWLEENDML
jgi:TolB-like protein